MIGYLEVKETLEKTEKIQNEILEKDPLLIFDYRSVKGIKINNVSFDDRAYIRFKIKK